MKSIAQSIIKKIDKLNFLKTNFSYLKDTIKRMKRPVTNGKRYVQIIHQRNCIQNIKRTLQSKINIDIKN